MNVQGIFASLECEEYSCLNNVDAGINWGLWSGLHDQEWSCYGSMEHLQRNEVFFAGGRRESMPRMCRTRSDRLSRSRYMHFCTSIVTSIPFLLAASDTFN
jgi:hypothetical protein